jgi:hypothetical protein
MVAKAVVLDIGIIGVKREQMVQELARHAARSE